MQEDGGRTRQEIPQTADCKARTCLVVFVPYSITFASRSKKNYDVTEAHIASKFVFLDFYIAALCNLGFTISMNASFMHSEVFSQHPLLTI